MFMTRIISKVRKELELLEFCKDGELEILKIKDELCILTFEGDDFSYILKYSENGQFFKYIDVLSVLEKENVETGIVKFSNRLMIFNNYYNSPFYRVARDVDFENENFVYLMASWYSKIHSINVFDFDKIFNAFSLKNVGFIMKKYSLENNEYFRYILDNFKNIKIKLERIFPSIVCKGLLKEDIIISNDFKNIVVLAVEKFDVGYKFFDIEEILENFGSEMQEYFRNNYILLNEDEVVLFKAIGNLLKCCISVENKEFSEDFIEKINFNEYKDFLEWSKNLVQWY